VANKHHDEPSRHVRALGKSVIDVGGIGLHVFDGRSHKLIPWIDEVAPENGIPLKDEHWSTRVITIDQVAAFLGQIRAAKKRRGSR
jgi:hypothetical protein